MTYRRVGGHIEKLYAQGYIDKGKSGTTIKASTYTLRPVSNCHHSVNPPSFNGMGSFDTRKTDGHQDLFRQRGLGKTGLIVFDTLRAAGPIEADKLAAALPVKVSRRTVFRKLEIMQRAGLAVSEYGKWEIISTDLDLASRKLHVNGAAAKQRLLHHQERIENRRNLAEQREEARAELKALTDRFGVSQAAKAIGEEITTVSRWLSDGQYIRKASREKIRQATIAAEARSEFPNVEC
jgi:DNA-binding transcriptional ArsR family regulator